MKQNRWSRNPILAWTLTCCATAFASARGVVAADDPPRDVPPPTLVEVGVYVNQIHALNLHDNQFIVDFVVWFRWKGDGAAPNETFDVADGRVDSAHFDYGADLGRTHYVATRVVATVTQFWDIARFPLDNHTLQIAIEDNQNEDFKLQYLADTANSGANPRLQVPGWNALPGTAGVDTQRYQSNYGDTSLPTGHDSSYSRFVYSIPLVRPNWGYFIKLFFGLFVATGIAFLAFFIRPTDLDPRFGLGVGAIFAAVASEYVVSSSLPATHVLTMADILHILAFVFIFLSLVESTVSLHLCTEGGEAGLRRSRRLDRWSFAVLLTAFSGASVWTVFWY